MDTRVILLRELQTDTEGYLRRCVDSGQALVVELPDHRVVTIQPLGQDDDLISELIEHNPAFRDLLARSAAGPRKPFQPLGK